MKAPENSYEWVDERLQSTRNYHFEKVKYFLLPLWQGRNEGGKGGTIPRAPIHYGGAESMRGRLITAGGAEKSQQCHKFFLQYCKFAFERTKIRPWGAKLVFSPRAPFNLVTPLLCWITPFQHV